MSIPRDLEFLYELGSLRNVQRGWRQHLGIDGASDLEHTMRVVFLALLISRTEGRGDEEKIMKMALIHDVAETRTSDHSYVQKLYVEADEEQALEDTLPKTSFEDFVNICQEYKKRESIEAQIVKDADNLDIDLELQEVAEQGHKLAKIWKKNHRQMVRDKKLYTKSAKKIWDSIQKSSPSSWHLKANKWKLDPTAGK